jgi:hypothetical protein
MKPLPEKSIVMKALQNMFTEQHSGKLSPRQFYYSTGGLMRDYPEQFNRETPIEVKPIPTIGEKKSPPQKYIFDRIILDEDD